MCNITFTKDPMKADAITTFKNGRFSMEQVWIATIIDEYYEKKGFTICNTNIVPTDSDVIAFKVINTNGKKGNNIDFVDFGYDDYMPTFERSVPTPYSSCGRVWDCYGPKIVKDKCYNPKNVHIYLDQYLFAGLDAADAKLNNSRSNINGCMDIGYAIEYFNPNWDDDTKSVEDLFIEAVDFCELLFERILQKAISNAEAEEIYRLAIEESDGFILDLTDETVPWKYLLQHDENPKARDILVVITKQKDMYVWNCTPLYWGTFKSKVSAPNSWCNLKGAKLQYACGFKDAIFVNRYGNKGGTKTLNTAKDMAYQIIKRAL